MANEEFLVDPAFPDIYDRSLVGPARDRVLFREGKIAQASEVVEAFSIEQRKRTAIGNLAARDGDRIEGAAILVDIDAETVTLGAGRIYLRGDVKEVAAASLSDVAMTGDVVVGVRVLTVLVTHEEDDTLLGLHDGSEAFGEDGAIREVLSLTWGWNGDGEDGDLYQVYQIRDGFVVDQTPPPSLTGFNQAIAVYDYDAHENYIARGCRVTPLGLSDGKQWFSIEEGVANILGFKRTRSTATRYGETETPDLLTIDAEPHSFADGGSGTAVIALNRTPINSVSSVIVTKQKTVTIVRGGVANTADLLPDTGVTSISLVKQGATTYASPASYTRVGDTVSWAPGGAEPAGGSSYDVTYQYLAAVTPTAVSSTTVTITGGVQDSAVLVGYTYKLPRHDRICLDRDGQVVYLKGLPAVEQPQPPQTPAMLLSLCVVKNDWFGTPIVLNDGTRAIPFEQQWRFFNRLVEMIDLVALNRLQLDISVREPVAKKGVFVDPLNDDRYRDAGESQNGAVFNGSFQIPITPSFAALTLSGPVTLGYTEEAVIQQLLITGCTPINPYQAFAPLPARMTLSPSQDFWTESQEIWNSPATQVFGQGNESRVTNVEVVSSTQQTTARFLRQISVAFTIDGFGTGETLSQLSFDGIIVTPAGPLVGDGNGRVTGSFTIPANVAAGTKRVEAVGGSGAEASSRFTGEGRIEITTRQQVTTVQRFNNPPPREPREGNNNPPDPVAQSFMLTGGRHVSSIEVKFCAIGDVSEPVICELVAVDNGYPTSDVIAQTETNMASALIGAWHKFTFSPPVFIPEGQEVAFVLKTNDPVHSVSLAARGGFDAARQEWVGAQPYTVGVRFSSSNARAWTAHQDEDLTFRLNCAVFAPTTKTVSVGVIAVTAMSDLLIEAETFLPTAAARLVFEVEPEGEVPVRVEPGQVLERQSYFTGNVAIRAILTGSAAVSPILGKDVLAIKGHMEANGVYVSRAFEMGTNIRLDAVMKTKLPSGSALTVENDAANDTWQTLPQTLAEALADGSFERTYEDSDYTAVQGRIRLTLTGSPAARPSVSDLRAFSI